MKVLFAFAFAVICLSCSAQKTPSLPRCVNNPESSQADLNTCASNEAKRVDGKRKVLYKKLLAAIANDPLAAAKVKTAEKAWIAYRDAYVEATYPQPDKQVNYGSMFPMEVDLLIAGLTEDHIKDLTGLLKNYTEIR